MPRNHRTLLLLGLLVAASATGCAGVRQEVRTPPPPINPQGVVFVADGAGGWHATSLALGEVLAEARLPLAVERVEWTHGYYRVFADQMDYCHAQAEGRRLAAQVMAYRQACRGKVYLLGHSAGSAVILAAAEVLPPDSVDRILLLAPSVSMAYDVRPALRCAREGLDVFHSGRDYGYLGVCVAITGTADRRWCPAAGRVGFSPPCPTAADAVLYGRLRQHAWDPSVEWTGNHGGHYGSHHPQFLRAYMLPLLNVPAG